MRTIIVFTFIMIFSICHAENDKLELYAERYTIIFFERVHPEKWPMLFYAAVPENDTIKVNLSNIETFTSALYSTCSYVPMFIGPIYIDVYKTLFGGVRQQIYDDEDDFLYILTKELESSMRQSVKFQLKSGDTIYASFCNLTGVFVKPKKDQFKHYSAVSIGIPNTDVIQSMVIPVAIMATSSTNKIVFSY